MENSISRQNVDVNVRAVVNDPNVTVQYKTKILQKNIVGGVNTLVPAMISEANVKYVIKYDYTLSENITIPANCVLEFDGGSLSNGIISANSTKIKNGIFNNIQIISNGGSEFDIDRCVFTVPTGTVAIKVSGVAEKIINISNCVFNGIYGNNDNTSAIILGEQNDCVNTVIDHCFFYRITDSIILKNNIHPLVISNCHFEFGLHDIATDTSHIGVQSNVSIYGCHFQGGSNGWRPISLNTATCVQIKENLIQFSKRDNVSGIVLTGCADVEVSGIYLEYGGSNDKDTNHCIVASLGTSISVHDIRACGYMGDILKISGNNWGSWNIFNLSYVALGGVNSLNYYIANGYTNANNYIFNLTTYASTIANSLIGVRLPELYKLKSGEAFLSSPVTIDLTKYVDGKIMVLQLSAYVVNSGAYDSFNLPVEYIATSSRTGSFVGNVVEWSYNGQTHILTLTKKEGLSYNPLLKYDICIRTYKRWSDN